MPWPQRALGVFRHANVDTFHAYPHLLHRELKQRFLFPVVNVIVTAVGGETSLEGSELFSGEVLNHRPDVVTIDYGLNDRGMKLKDSRTNWERMIGQALDRNIKAILMTPIWDSSDFLQDGNWSRLTEQAEQIREIASAHSIGLCDSYQAFQEDVEDGGDLADLLSHINHPNGKGHALIAQQLSRWFMACGLGYT